MNILVFNAGSSSLKFSLFNEKTDGLSASGLMDWAADPKEADFIIQSGPSDKVHSRLEIPDYRTAVSHLVRSLIERGLISQGGRPSVKAIGHRVVHGGVLFRDSVLIDHHVKSTIKRLIELAPLHNPPALETIEAAGEILPGIPHVAVFDTAYYTNMPPRSYVYPLPYEWYTEWGIRRFGFHGISHSYCAGRAAEMLDRKLADLRIVICHLGHGCSATAIRSGLPAATTMGFTPMEGLMMGTRPGSIDPGIILYVQQKKGISSSEMDRLLNHESGLLGISGISSDFRRVEEAARKGNPRAQLALEIFASRIREAIGALTVAMDGIDALVFTAGVGENSAELRASVCSGLECLGIELDEEKNASCKPDMNIATPGSQARILVIHTREDLMIAKEVERIASVKRGLGL